VGLLGLLGEGCPSKHAGTNLHVTVNDSLYPFDPVL